MDNQSTRNFPPGAQVLSNSAIAAVDAAALERLTRQKWSVSSYEQRRHNRLPQRLVILSIFFDAVIIGYAFLAARWMALPADVYLTSGMSSATGGGYGPYLIFSAVTLLMILAGCGAYQKSALLRNRYVAMQVAKGCFVWFCGFFSLSCILQFHPAVPRSFVILAGADVVVALLLWRALFHRFLRRSEVATKLRQRILFVGWNEESSHLTESFEEGENPAYEVVGCVSSSRGNFQEAPGAVPVLGQVSDLSTLVHREQVDIVLLADVDCDRQEIMGVVNVCEKEMVQFKMIPSYFQILVSGLHLQTVNGIPVLGVTALPLDRGINNVLKRVLDIIGAVVGLVLFAPVIALCGYLVNRESPGPIFYKQRRLGRNGLLFDIYKIRSMRLDAEKDGVGWSTKNDPRRLAIGTFMRRWNIDELPQFWNVLKGEMSLVGPRPERPELIANFKEEIPHYNARHNAKPGITGWAQVKGFRGDTDLTERVRCDLFYLENWSLLMDVQIMAMTVLSNKNAC